MQRRSQYRSLGRVGTGQFGQVFCGMHRYTGELVALKQLDPRQFPTHRFLRELHILARLQHPNVVSLHTLEYNPGGRYLVMDYCEAGTLRDLINTPGRLSPRLALQLMQDVLQGLAHAHSAGVVHCDLKPENILLSLTPHGWRARIADFGIARIQDSEGRLELGGNTGSPAYMAPERFYGRCSAASDLYAVGVILYELITGDRPFEGIPADLMAAHMNQSVEVSEQVPFLIRSIISKALQKLPQKRYASADDMAHAVELATVVLDATPPLSAPVAWSRPAPVSTPLRCLSRCRFSHPIRQLAMCGTTLLIATPTQMEWRSMAASDLSAGEPNKPLASATGWPVPEGLQEIRATASGLLGVTQRPHPQHLAKVETAFYWLSTAAFQSGKPFPEPFYRVPAAMGSDQIALDPTGKWVALYELSTQVTGGIQLLHLPTGQPIQRFPLATSPGQLLALDRRYGLALIPAADQTHLQWFNRRGTWGSNPMLGTRIEWGVVGWACDREDGRLPQATLFALETGASPQGLLITLAPFRVQRLELPFTPRFGLAASWGYALIGAEGEVLCLDPTGQIRGQYNLGLETEAQITAVALISPYGLAVATQVGTQGHLHHFELPALQRQIALQDDLELQDYNLTQPEKSSPLSAALV